MADVGSSLCLCLMQTPGFSKITLLNDITDCQSFEIKHQRFFLKEALMSEQQCSRCDLLQLTKHASIRISLRRLTNVAPKLMKEKWKKAPFIWANKCRTGALKQSISHNSVLKDRNGSSWRGLTLSYPLNTKIRVWNTMEVKYIFCILFKCACSSLYQQQHRYIKAISIVNRAPSGIHIQCDVHFSALNTCSTRKGGMGGMGGGVSVCYFLVTSVSSVWKGKQLRLLWKATWTAPVAAWDQPHSHTTHRHSFSSSDWKRITFPRSCQLLMQLHFGSSTHVCIIQQGATRALITTRFRIQRLEMARRVSRRGKQQRIN